MPTKAELETRLLATQRQIKDLEAKQVLVEIIEEDTND